MIRQANTNDINQIQFVRNIVKENTLSHPSFATDEDCRIFIVDRGKGWVYEKDERIIGFAIADLKGNNIWALFVHPYFEKQGIGKQLHDIMVDWYFSQTDKTLWLGTAPNTRAEIFYKKAGWEVVGIHGKGEIKFEMTSNKWSKSSNY